MLYVVCSGGDGSVDFGNWSVWLFSIGTYLGAVIINDAVLDQSVQWKVYGYFNDV